ncbi:MAG: helix-turn-helix transcriptional regulator [Bacteroidales bacterium]|nr:helix-turn-helix transcriptional regulator [Bacteroidales bacterium]MCM1148087.1 helix-turn-helix transcriptional regulator [Bacteroidales bacterium]MCM1509457.1 helix-turn-helix transcriptional regulator [Clostridium sp.]
MTGSQLKQILLTAGYSAKAVAEKAGMSQQSFSQMLAAADIKSGLLERIAKVLNKDMTFFYPCASGTHVPSTPSATRDEIIARVLEQNAELIRLLRDERG